MKTKLVLALGTIIILTGMMLNAASITGHPKSLTVGGINLAIAGAKIPDEKYTSSFGLARAEGLPDKIRRQRILRKESLQSLLGLVEDIFGANLSLHTFPLDPAHIHGEYTEEEEPTLVEFNSSHYLIDDLYGELWKQWLIGDAIHGKISIDKAYLERFLEEFFTTYFVAAIKNLKPWQHYIIHISDRSLFEEIIRSL